MSITVQERKIPISITQASGLVSGTECFVEGIVVGVAHEGKSNDKELLIKDVSSDTVIAVRNIPYGSFPDFGYEKGDRIEFIATVKVNTKSNDVNKSVCYTAKKYLDFSEENGAIESTVISTGNKVIYTSLEDAVVIDTWEDMVEFFGKSNENLYAYLKITAGAFLNYYKGTDTENYRIHHE